MANKKKTKKRNDPKGKNIGRARDGIGKSKLINHLEYIVDFTAGQHTEMSRDINAGGRPQPSTAQKVTRAERLDLEGLAITDQETADDMYPEVETETPSRARDGTEHGARPGIIKEKRASQNVERC